MLLYLIECLIYRWNNIYTYIHFKNIFTKYIFSIDRKELITNIFMQIDVILHSYKTTKVIILIIPKEYRYISFQCTNIVHDLNSYHAHIRVSLLCTKRWKQNIFSLFKYYYHECYILTLVNRKIMITISYFIRGYYGNQ